MADAFAGHNKSLISPGQRLEPVTAHDTNELDPSKGIMVNASGSVVLRLKDDTANRTVYLLAGVVHPLEVKLVHTSTDSAVKNAGINLVY